MTALELLKAYNQKNKYGNDERSLWETLREESCIFSEEICSHRWWTTVFRVVKIDDSFIGFEWAETTGDDSARDKGWEPDLATICFCEPFDVTVTKYRKKS